MTAPTAAALRTATALACVAVRALPSAPERHGTGQAREAFEAFTLTCPGGDTNSASPDGGSASLRAALLYSGTTSRATSLTLETYC